MVVSNETSCLPPEIESRDRQDESTLRGYVVTTLILGPPVGLLFGRKDAGYGRITEAEGPC